VIAPWIDAELRNWSAWCRSGPWPHPIPPDRAASAEGRYIAESDLGNDDAPPPPIKPIARRAEIVHRVYRERLTERERWVLVWRYVRPIDDRVAIRRLRITRKVYEQALMDSARRVGEAFRNDGGKHSFRA
jgi:hypothetical protein